MEEIKFWINDIEVTVIKKKIKNLYIRIHSPEGNVVVSVPQHTKQKTIEKFLEKHYEWIVSHREKVICQNEENGKKYCSGETHYLWGEPYELQVERSMKKPLTEMRNGKIYMRVTAKSTEVERRKQLDIWYRKKMEECLKEVIPSCESTVGKQAMEWKFRRMKTRWGSCNIQKKRICLNIQLAEMPRECLEYVVTHELTHLHEAGHNARFWGLMDQYYPTWRAVKKKLKNHT